MKKPLATFFLGVCFALFITAACAEGYDTGFNESQQRQDTERLDQQTDSPTATPSPTTPSLTRFTLRNAEYVDPWSQDERVKLQDGVFSRRPEVWRLHDLIAFGDLSSDGIEDAAVVLSYSGGGSGTFLSLLAVINEEGEPLHVASASIGDRIRINSLTIEEAIIILDVVAHGPDDAMCCPTLELARKYELIGSDLRLLSEEPLSEAPTPEPTAENPSSTSACLSSQEVKWANAFYDGLIATNMHRTRFEEASNSTHGQGKTDQERIDWGHVAHGHLSDYSQALNVLLQELRPAPSDCTLDLYESLEFLELTANSIVVKYANQWEAESKTIFVTLLPLRMTEFVLTISYALVGEEVCPECRRDSMSKTLGVAGYYNRIADIPPCESAAS